MIKGLEAYYSMYENVVMSVMTAVAAEQKQPAGRLQFLSKKLRFRSKDFGYRAKSIFSTV